MRTPSKIFQRRGDKRPCGDMEARLFDFLSGELPSAGMRRVREHLHMCLGCREALAGMKAVVRALRKADAESRGPEELSAASRRRILAAVGWGPTGKVRRT